MNNNPMTTTTSDNIRAFVNIHLKDADEATKDDAIKNLEDLVQAAIDSKPKPSGKTKEEIASEWTGLKLELFTETQELKHIHPYVTPKQCLKAMAAYAAQAIAEREASQWKNIEADSYEKSIGWKLNYDFLKAMAEKAADMSGEQVQMEAAEAVLIAFRSLPTPYKEDKKEGE